VAVNLAAPGPAAPRRGAEASVEAAGWLGVDAVRKHRLPKPYRHAALDARLRAARTRTEASLLAAARAAGVPVPLVLDADLACAELVLERIDGPTLRDALRHADDAQALRLAAELGTLTARLHAGGLTHGDLTTSNAIVSPQGLVLLDFGLGSFSEQPEDHGVDLHLVEEALEATDARAAALTATFLEAYTQAWPAGASKALHRLEQVRGRGRYR
jgi:Kae1-associated kinase Bud32